MPGNGSRHLCAGVLTLTSSSVLGHLRTLTTRVTHVLPVSDDGGSTAEIVRVLGGPAVGDLRSRCLRLADSSDEEGRAVKALLAHRLSATDALAAKQEWYNIVEGQHMLWQGVSQPYKHVIRAFLAFFQAQIFGHSTARFDFSNGSIGNFFFAGARTFFRSLEAAVFLFSRVARIPEGCMVLPAICTEHVPNTATKDHGLLLLLLLLQERITLGAELEDGTVIKGQNQISHPPSTEAPSSVCKQAHGSPPLPAPIRRVFYLSSEGTGQQHEVLPSAHPTALAEVQKADAVIYGMGSLYTSICPIVCLSGMGEAIASREIPKIMLLNGSHDRETSSSGAHEGPMTAADMVQAISDALNRRRNRQGQRLRHPPSSYVTALLVPKDGSITVDHQALKLLGIKHILEVESVPDAEGSMLFEPAALVTSISRVLQLSKQQQ
ncbi:hypothetical protein QJQ45_020058 [Haematococcus lacustris]|nr:hypothetical protein QJQ45_020058 [Haematococcus lacustris]